MMSIDKLLKNVNILQARTDKNRTTALTTKPQKQKLQNEHTFLKIMQCCKLALF